MIRALKNLPQLSKLSLNSCNLIIPCLEALKEALSENLILTELSLYSNEIDAEGAQLIAQTLVNKSNLRTLGLSNNIIGTGGARELAQVCLVHLTSLQRLALESNLVGNMGLDAMT